MSSPLRLKRKRHLPTAWEGYRLRVVEMYQKELKPLPEIVQALKQECGFSTTETALKMKLSRWKVRREQPTVESNSNDLVSHPSALGVWEPSLQQNSTESSPSWQPPQNTSFFEDRTTDVLYQANHQFSAPTSNSPVTHDNYGSSRAPISRSGSLDILAAATLLPPSLPAAPRVPEAVPMASSSNNLSETFTPHRERSADSSQTSQASTSSASTPPMYATDPKMRLLRQEVKDKAVASLDRVCQDLAKATDATKNPCLVILDTRNSRVRSLGRFLSLAIFLHGDLTEPFFQQAHDYCSLCSQRFTRTEDTPIDVTFLFKKICRLRRDIEGLQYSTAADALDDVYSVAMLYTDSRIGRGECSELLRAIVECQKDQTSFKPLDTYLEAYRWWAQDEQKKDGWEIGMEDAGTEVENTFSEFFGDFLSGAIKDYLIEGVAVPQERGREAVVSLCKKFTEIPWPHFNLPGLNTYRMFDRFESLLPTWAGSESSHVFLFLFKSTRTLPYELRLSQSIKLFRLFLEKDLSESDDKYPVSGDDAKLYFVWCSAFTSVLRHFSVSDDFQSAHWALHRAWTTIPDAFFKETSQDALKQLATQCAIREAGECTKIKAEILLKLGGLIDGTFDFRLKRCYLGDWNGEFGKVLGLLKEALEECF